VPGPETLLERYVEAKDCVRPQLMEGIYIPDAVLTYSIATDTIDFPARVCGVAGITRTLVRDFSLRFARCRTYYLCAARPAPGAAAFDTAWLVLMRETAAACLRIGKGFYRWRFASAADGARVSGMHIHIQRMDRIDDPDAGRLARIQAALPYPWLPAATLDERLGSLAAQHPDLSFLETFRRPVDPAAQSECADGSGPHCDSAAVGAAPLASR
jgi:hypothetical protein